MKTSLASTPWLEQSGVVSDYFSQLMALAVALGLGLLAGMQREWKHNRVAGLRTFALVSLAGALTMMDQLVTALVIAGTVMVLLQGKKTCMAWFIRSARKISGKSRG